LLFFQEFDISKKCEYLFKLDYSLIELDNTNGLLSPRYPGRILIPECEHGHMAKTLVPGNGLFGPVGGGLPGGGGGGGSSGTTATATPLNSSAGSTGSEGVGIQAFVTFANPLQTQQQQHPLQQQYPSQQPHPLQAQLQFSYDEVIKSDIQLLHTLNVSTIVDLMVENRKIKYFMA